MTMTTTIVTETPRGGRRIAIVSIAALLWIVVIDHSLRTYWQLSSSPPRIGSSSSGRLRSRSPSPSLIELERYHRSRTTNLPRRTDRYEQWKTSIEESSSTRRLLNKTVEWEDDDDDDAVPFHLQDDDATSNITDSKINKGDGILSENQTNGMEDQGIIYSESVGLKESDPIVPRSKRPPPPPPPPPIEKNKQNENINLDDGKDNGAKVGNDTASASEKDGSTYPNNQTLAKIVKNDKKNDQQKQQQSTSLHDDSDDDSPPADTIFDDLTRGFTFASLFCAALACLHKTCSYACIRLGFSMDGRVVEARWRRLRLKRKKSYRNVVANDDDDDNDNDDLPPLDTRKWGEWMSKRENIGRGSDGDYYNGGGVWDSGFAQERLGEDAWDDEDSIGAGGEIKFDVELATWDNNDGEDATSEMELEYGEGDDLEDKSHDSRLFDADDGGRGMEREADTFFEGRNQEMNVKAKKNGCEKGKGISDGHVNCDGNDFGSLDKMAVASNQLQPPSIAADQYQNDDNFFDALQPPCKNDDDAESLPPISQSDDGNNPLSAANDHAQKPSREINFLGIGNDIEKDDNVGNDYNDDDGDNHDQNTDPDNSFVEADDRGYDEENDLLGLRSDSPPPLDLEEMGLIEKKLREDMENAKLY